MRERERRAKNLTAELMADTNKVSFYLIYLKQECIPVGCVPAERWPYSEKLETPPKIWSRHPPENLEQAPPEIWSRHPPLWTDTRLWKYYLGQNFVSAGNYFKRTLNISLMAYLHCRTDSDPDSGMRPDNGDWESKSRLESESSQICVMGTVSIQYNIAIVFGVWIRVTTRVRLWLCH